MNMVICTAAAPGNSLLILKGMNRGTYFNKSFRLLLVCCCFSPASQAQDSSSAGLLNQLDSMRNSRSEAAHFAGIYYEVTRKAGRFSLREDSSGRQFMLTMEKAFAGYFFRAASAKNQGAPVPGVWAAYFADSTLKPLQYRLLGINAHINGDIWQALVASFSPGELRRYRKTYFRFNRSLAVEYKEVYLAAFHEHAKIRWLHFSTGGLDRFYGRTLLWRWRRRQYRLALLYHTNPAAFERKARKTRQKTEYMNRLILRHL